MNTKALFENSSIRCRVEITNDNGEVTKRDFTKVSNLINYCKQQGVEIPIESCLTVDWLPNFDCEY